MLIAPRVLLFVVQHSGYGVTYTNWDAEMVHICDCYLGYTGPDCSLKMCPKADDPLTQKGFGFAGTVTVTSNTRWPAAVAIGSSISSVS